MKALQESKQDPLPLIKDGVVVLRLTRSARSPTLDEFLKTTATLAQCTQRVQDAECSIEHFGKDGPLCFVSVTAPQLTESEIVMSFDRVVLLHSEIALGMRCASSIAMAQHAQS